MFQRTLPTAVTFGVLAASAVQGLAVESRQAPVFDCIPVGSLETGGGPKKALYFLENQPAGAKLGAVEILPNGTLANPAETPTGGLGMIAKNNTNGMDVAADVLFSQGAVASGDDFVFAVNPGSNTLSMFRINPWDPTRPVLVGKPADTLGEFPMSVDYSSILKTACVMNGGAKAGVTCFQVDPQKGLTTTDAAPRALAGFNNTTPPSGPDESASQVSFSPSSSYVLAVSKGKKGSPGALYAWPVMGDTVSSGAAVVTRFNDVFSNFGFAFTGSDDSLFLSDAMVGGTTLARTPGSLSFTEVKQLGMGNLSASCWAAYSAPLGQSYAIDAGAPQFAAVDATTGDASGFVALDPAVGGAFDTVVDGVVAYFLGAKPFIGVVNLAPMMWGKSTPTVQSLNLAGVVGDRKYWSGLAMYPNYPQWW